MSTLCFFLLLGGGAYAAKQLPKNRVGSPQIKKNAVSKAKIKKNSVNGPKVKNNSLTGADIKLSKLGTVPSASNAATASTANTANTANLANSIPPAEPTLLVGAPGEPGFEDGSSNYGMFVGVTLQPVGFYKDHEGIVRLQRVAKVGAGAETPRIFTLPSGYRPANGTVIYHNALCLPTGPCEKDSEGDEGKYSPVLVAGSNTVTTGPTTLSGGVISQPERSVSLDGSTYRAES